jgi:hypothetical protein
MWGIYSCDCCDPYRCLGRSALLVGGYGASLRGGVSSRAVGFASLAIVLVVLSLSYQLALALRSGAILVTLVWLILLLKLAYLPSQET